MITVEYIDGSQWIIYSKTENEDHAIIQAEVLHNSRGSTVRVIQNGKVIFQLSK